MKGLYAALDANFNRACEGIRVCEDIFRFAVKDSCSESFKTMRHRLAGVLSSLPRQELLNARDVAGDSQKFFDTESESVRSGTGELFFANIRRAAEAVRAMEEFSKTMPGNMSSEFQKIRFELYGLEKSCAGLISRRGALSCLSFSLYVIVDSAFVDADEIPETAAFLAGLGVKAIQVRMKNHSDREYLDVCRKTAPLCRDRGALFIVNDSPHIAVLSGAGGLHLGQSDISPAEARAITGESMLIGLSAESIGQACDERASAADYIAVGPVFSTSSKDGSILDGLGTDVLKEASEAAGKPVVAIGGIEPELTGSLIEAGASSVSVISSIFRGGKIEDNVKAFEDVLARYRKGEEL